MARIALRPDECVLRHVTRTSRAVVNAFDAALAPVGLTGSQFNVLMSLERAGPMTVNALARHVGADATTIPRTLRPLKLAKLVSSRPGADRREQVIAVTPSGHRRLAVARRRWTVVQRRIVEAIGRPSWIALTRSLGAIRQAARARVSTAA